MYEREPSYNDLLSGYFLYFPIFLRMTSLFEKEEELLRKYLVNLYIKFCF